MDDQTAGQETAGKFTKSGVKTLKDAYSKFLQDPLFLAGKKLAQQRVDQPYTFTPEVIAGMKARAREGAQTDYEGALGSSLERAGAAGAYRSGSTRGMEQRLAQGLGSTVANLNRDIDTQAALQRPVDISNALNSFLPTLAAQFQFPRDIANTYAGAASNPIWNQPSPFAQLLGGIGGVGGGLLGAGATGNAIAGRGILNPGGFGSA